MSSANILNYISQANANGDNAYHFGGSVFGSKIAQTALVTATLAEINAGKTLIAAVEGASITILDYKAKVTGGFSTTTAVLVQDTTDTPVVIATNAVAALTNGNILNEKTSNVTMGAGYLASLAAGKGVVVANSGSAATGGTSITFRIEYTIA
jgi:hypothetical protein